MRSLLVLFLLALLTLPAAAQETATDRFNQYLSTARKAKTLAEIRPFFTDKAWQQSYAEMEGSGPAQQAADLAAVAEEFGGWTVKSETLKDGKAVLTIGPDKGKGTEVLLIKHNGRWTIDG